MKIKMLLVDDHPSMLEGYKVILSNNKLGYEIEFVSAHTCEEAYKLITSPTLKNTFDVVFMDYNLPAYEQKQIYSGEDLALIIKGNYPKTKIVFVTSHTEAVLLYRLSENIDPNGLLLKGDFSSNELNDIFGTIMSGTTFYTHTASSQIDNMLAKSGNLDQTCIEILTLMKQGVLTKNIPRILDISLSSVEKRKVLIKDYLELPKGNDQEVLLRAKKYGIIF